MNEFGSSLLLARVQHEDTVAVASASFARPQDNNPGHLLLVDGHGTLYQTQLPSSVLNGQGSLSQVSVSARFELFLANQDDPIPVQRAWSCFACQDDGLIFAHIDSCNLLFVPLPTSVGECSATFLFGKQSGAVTCLASHGHTLISGGRDGGVCLWDTATGQKLDTHQPPLSAGGVTAVAFIGPLMISSGDEFGCITIFDISGRVLMPVSRFFADDGPVSYMAAATPLACQLNIGSACAPRPPDGGGVMQPPVALPWRSMAVGQDDSQGTSTGALLAVASTAGWLHVFQPSSPSHTHAHMKNPMDPSNGWQEAYSGSLPGLPCGLEFAKEGEYLMVATDLQLGGKIMVLHTRSWAAAAEMNTSHHLASAGLLHPAGQLAVVPETLEPALQLDMYLVPHNGLPSKQQVTLPFKRAADPIIAIRATAGPVHSNTLPSQATKTVTGEGFLGFQPIKDDVGPAPETHKQATSVLGRSTLSFRPSTLPVGRSWLGGGQPQIDLDDVLSATIPAHRQPGGLQEQLRDGSHSQQVADVDEQPVGNVHAEQHAADQDRPVTDVVPLQEEQHITVQASLHNEDVQQGQGSSSQYELSHAVHAATESSSYVERQQQDSSNAHKHATEDVGFDEDELQPRTIPAHLTPTTRRTVSHSMSLLAQVVTGQQQQDEQQQQQQRPHVLQSGDQLPTQAGITEEAHVGQHAAYHIEQSLNELTLRPEGLMPGQSADENPLADTIQETGEAQGDDDDGDHVPDHNEFLTTQYFGNTLDRYSDPSYSHDLQPDDQNLDHMAEPLDGKQHHGDHDTMDQQPVCEWQGTKSFPDFVSSVPLRTQLSDDQQQFLEGAKTKPAAVAAVGKLSAHNGPAAGLRGELHSRRRAMHNVQGAVTHRIQVGHTEGQQPSQADGDAETAPRPQALPRSPYRGYKPSMAVLLKELRAKNRATRQATAAIHKQTHQQRHGVSIGNASAVDTLAHDQSSQQQGMQEIVTPRGRDDAAAYHNQQNQQQQQQLRRMSVGTSHLASPMLMGSPIASEAARSRAFDHGEKGVPDQRQTAHEMIPHATHRNALAAWQSEPPDNEGQLETEAAGLLKYCQLNSTLHLVSRMEALAKGDVGIPALSPHEQAEAVRRAAAITANVPQHVNLYSNLPPLASLPPPPKPVKQLDPRWVASRNVKPEISMLWDAQEQQQEVVSSKGVAVYTRPTPQALAQDVLSNAATMRISL